MRNSKLISFFRKYRFLVTGAVAVLAILVALLIGAILIVAVGKNPLQAYQSFFNSIFGNAYSFGETMNKFVPLLCCALSFSVANKAGFFNIGCEGQLYMGAIGAVLVGLNFEGMPPALHITLAILAGMLGGMLLSGLAGMLKMVFGANELITTLLLNYIITYVVGMLVSGPLKDPKSMLEQTKRVLDSAKLPLLMEGSRLHLGVVIVLVVTFLVWLLQQKTVVGYEMRLSGTNAKSALYAGVNIKRSLILVIILSGALSGMGGALELLGNQYKLIEGFSSSYGFDAIGMAVMGQHHPVGMILSAFLFAALRVGANGMQRSVGIPLPMFYILQGVIIICVIVSNYFVQRIMDSMVEGRA